MASEYAGTYRQLLNTPIIEYSSSQRRPQLNRGRAQHCERARSLAVALEARLMYFDLAQEWREWRTKSRSLTERPIVAASNRAAFAPATAVRVIVFVINLSLVSFTLEIRPMPCPRSGAATGCGFKLLARGRLTP